MILRLTPDNFDTAIETNPFVLVEFYAPWCGHCKQLEPEFEGAADALSGRAILAKVDATVEKDLAARFDIKGYPTLHFFKDGKNELYDGGLREAASIVAWVEAHMGSALRNISSDEVSSVVSQRGHQSLFLVSGGQEERQRFEVLANSNRAMGHWYIREAAEPSLILYRGVGETLSYQGDMSNAEAAMEFIKAELLPRFGEIGEHNYEAYLTKNHEGMFWVCFSPDSFQEDARQYKAVFTELATRYPHYHFVFTDTKEYAEHVKEELGCVEFPTVVLQMGKWENGLELPRFKKALRESPILVDTVASFIEGVLAGAVEPDDGLDDLDASDAEEPEEDSDL